MLASSLASHVGKPQIQKHNFKFAQNLKYEKECHNDTGQILLQ